MKPVAKVWVILATALLAACASSGAGDAQSGGEKIAAANCMSRLDTERATCEQACPQATGNEHFSVQHKMARENIACKEQCMATRSERAAQCTMTR